MPTDAAVLHPLPLYCRSSLEPLCRDTHELVQASLMTGYYDSGNPDMTWAPCTRALYDVCGAERVAVERLSISFAQSCDFGEPPVQEPRNASLVSVWSLGSGGSACWCQAKSESWQPVMCGSDAVRAEALEMCKDEDEYPPCCSIGSEVVSDQMLEMPDVLKPNVKKHVVSVDISSPVSNKSE